MRLPDFILRDMDRILAHWEAFAATRLPAAASMASLELRDHAQQILEAIALDLSAPQSREEQSAKSMGLAPAPFPAWETAAQTHAVVRQKSGYDIKQLASEYRALRASVLSMYLDACLPAAPPIDNVIRFNEAIDQALAESIGHFSAQVEQARNLLLGMLSHDMRSPLQTVQMTAVYLGQLNAGSVVSAAAGRLIRSGAHLQALLDDFERISGLASALFQRRWISGQSARKNSNSCALHFPTVQETVFTVILPNLRFRQPEANTTAEANRPASAPAES